MSFEFQIIVVPVQRPEPVASHQPPPSSGSSTPPAHSTPNDVIVFVFKEVMKMLPTPASNSSPEIPRLKGADPTGPLPIITRSPAIPSEGGRKPVENVNNPPQQTHPHPHGIHPPQKSSGAEPTGKSADPRPEETPKKDEKVMPEPAKQGEDTGKKAMEDIARELAKKLIPEKFTFLFQPGLHFRNPYQNHVPKEEKPQAEDLHQKAPSSKSQSVAKGEAKTLQTSGIPEEIDPAEKVGKEMFHNVVGKLPVKEAEFPTSLPWMKVEMKEDPKNLLEKLLGHVPQKNVEQTQPMQPPAAPAPTQPTNPAIPHEMLVSQPSAPATPAQAAPPAPGPGPVQAGNLPMSQQVVPPARVDQNAQPNQAQPYIIPNDPARLLAKGHAHIGRIPDGREHAHVRPRQDAIAPRDKNEQAQANAPRQIIDDKNIPRIPIMPDFALSKEGILKELGHGGEAFLRDDDGFKLEDLILMLLCAVICGARKVDEVYRYLHARETFFTTWMGLRNGMPSHRLLSILMYRLDPTRMQELYLAALGKRTSALQGARVWESDRGMILGVLTDESSVQLQDGLQIFDLKRAILTTDPQSLEPRLSRIIQSKEADYLIAIKGMHGNAYDCAQEFFGATLLEQSIRQETSHHVMHEGSRVMQREVLVADNVAWLPSHESWTGLRTAIRLKAQIVDGSRITSESRVFVSSLPLDVQAIAGALRTHSTLESRVEWFLDLDFTRGGVEHVMENFDALRKISWELLNFESTQKATPEAKRKKALVDTTYLRKVLGLLVA